METCRLTSSHVRLGMPLPGDIYDETGQMLLSKGYVIDTQSQLDTLLERGMYVDVSVFEARFKSSASAATAPPPEKRHDPFLIWQNLKIGLNRLVGAIVNGAETADKVVEFADHVIEYTFIDSEAAIAAGLLDHHEESYPVSHCLASAALCALLARCLGWPSARQCSIACAALTMNTGFLDVQHRLQRQTTPLNAVQMQQVQAHPESAVEALRNIGVDDSSWLNAVLQHHEKPAGGGYPAHRDEPSEEAELLRLVDVFGARAHGRGDRRPLPPAQILRTLFAEEGKGPNGTLVGALIKTLGIYPPGSYVKLESDEIGVVFRHGESANTPVVAAVTNAKGTPTMQPVRRETHRKGFAIVSPVAPDKVSVGYDLAKLWITSAPKTT